jgi:hypothetical protein
MWWLLVPVIGAVVAAVTSSDDEEKEAAERRARAQAREAEAQAVARRKYVEIQERKAQLVADANTQLNDLFPTHSAVLDLSYKAPLHVSFDNLKVFASKKVPTNPNSMLKHLETIAPHAIFSATWTINLVQAEELRNEIKSLKRLKDDLLSESL